MRCKNIEALAVFVISIPNEPRLENDGAPSPTSSDMEFAEEIDSTSCALDNAEDIPNEPPQEDDDVPSPMSSDIGSAEEIDSRSCALDNVDSTKPFTDYLQKIASEINPNSFSHCYSSTSNCL